MHSSNSSPASRARSRPLSASGLSARLGAAEHPIPHRRRGGTSRYSVGGGGSCSSPHLDMGPDGDPRRATGWAVSCCVNADHDTSSSTCSEAQCILTLAQDKPKCGPATDCDSLQLPATALRDLDLQLAIAAPSSTPPIQIPGLVRGTSPAAGHLSLPCPWCGGESNHDVLCTVRT